MEGEFFRLRAGAEPPALRPVDFPEHDPSCPWAYKGDGDPTVCLCSCGYDDKRKTEIQGAKDGD